jgi:toxin ParE1/3/4
MNPITWHAGARRDYREAVDYYEDQRKGLGDEFAAEIDAAIARIMRHPETWPQISQHSRRVLARRFPYDVVYQLVDDRIYINAVRHLRRMPNYWVDREKRS